MAVTPDRLRDIMRRQRSGSAGFCADRTQGYAEKPRSVYSFFDGFRTSHAVNKIIPLADETIRPDAAGGDRLTRARALNQASGDSWNFSESGHLLPVSRSGTNPWYNAVYDHVEEAMRHLKATLQAVSTSHLNIMAIPG